MTADNITPLIPMTAASMALLSDQERRDYWLAVARKWERTVAEIQQEEFQRDRDDARHNNDWSGA